MAGPLTTIIHHSLEQPVPVPVTVFAERLALNYGIAARAVLFYGSSLRTGDLTGTLLDFYLLVDDYNNAYGKAWLAVANQLIPPNVFYAEQEIDGQLYRAKYAVLSVDHFRHLASPSCFNVSIWARFSQPSVLVWCKPGVREAVISAVAQAPVALLKAAWPLLPARAAIRDVWTTAFGLTYGSELRAEKKNKGVELFDLAPDYYRAITGPALDAAGLPFHMTNEQVVLEPEPSALGRAWGNVAWALRSLQGKLLSVARLIKASATFDGGIDYLAWKISRHSGVPVTIKPWHRRHPIIGGLVLFLQLRRKGAVR